ncbi:MAG: NAD(P)/FAD-dependent oxidoreductase, partial [Acinetobacter sp.]|nr:NAD(P)/FAD-dependent oxidoreductase [Acinetobacter sp.]
METQLEIEQADVQAPSDQMQDQTTTPKSVEAQPKQTRKKAVLRPKAVQTYDTIVVGAGISGIAAAYKMKQVGYQDYLVLEKAERVGGTWRDNNYPGCGCDVPSALYSFSFAPSHQWSHLFAKQPEILSYLERVVEQFELQDKICFQHELLSAKLNEEANIWQLETSQGAYQARTVIFSTGPITEPSLPNIKGIEGFKGEMFHSARWKHDYDLTGKRVAVIGTGASAIQFIPQIQPLAKELIVFQRTAPWVLPKADMQLNATVKSLVAKFPMIQQGWRKSVSSILNAINFGLRHPSLLEPVNVLSRQLLKLQIQDDTLRKAVTPNFSIGCKRLLFANNYYPALQQDNVTLLSQGLVEIDGQSVIAANG